LSRVALERPLLDAVTTTYYSNSSDRPHRRCTQVNPSHLPGGDNVHYPSIRWFIGPHRHLDHFIRFRMVHGRHQHRGGHADSRDMRTDRPRNSIFGNKPHLCCACDATGQCNVSNFYYRPIRVSQTFSTARRRHPGCFVNAPIRSIVFWSLV